MFHNVSSPAVKVLWGSRLSRSIEFLWYRRILRMTMRHVHHIFMSQFNIFIMHAMHVISRHSTELWLVSESNPAWSHPATHPDPPRSLCLWRPAFRPWLMWPGRCWRKNCANWWRPRFLWWFPNRHGKSPKISLDGLFHLLENHENPHLKWMITYDN